MTRRREHLDRPTATAYAAGTLPDAAADVVEDHLDACGRCAVAVSAAVRATPAAGGVLAAVRGSVLLAVACDAQPASDPGDGRQHRSASRRLGRLAWAVGPALRGPWLIALLLVCAGAAALAYGTGSAGVRPLLLLLAPVLPVVGVALSYGPGADPMHEIGASTPSGGLRLLLIRTAAVLAASLPLLTAADALLPRGSGPHAPATPGPVVWLLPGLALTLATLALGSFTGCRAAARIVAAGWTLVVLLPAAATSRGVSDTAVLAAQAAGVLAGPATQGGWAAAVVVSGVLLLVHRTSFDFGPGARPGPRTH